MKKATKYFAIIATLFFAASCSVQEPIIGKGGSNTGSTEVDIKFSMQSLGSTRSTTKAMNATAENTIKRIDILAFKVNGGSETFAYHTSTETIVDDSSEGAKKFTVKAKRQSGTQYRFVILANLPKAQGEALANLVETGTKAEVLANIQYSNSEKWKADGSNDTEFTPIPMWGETDVVVLTDQVVSDGIRNIKLARMLAKIDVAITTPEAMAVAKLKEVYLFKRNTSGYVAPLAANWSGDKAIKASVPGNTTTPELPLSYAVTNDVSLQDEIYTFESAALAYDDRASAISIVVGLLFEGKISYYRLNFNNPDKTALRDVLRNHTYKVNITKVTGAGEEEPGKAQVTIPAKIEAEIVSWDMSQTLTLVSDGQHVLNLSRGIVETTKESRSAADEDNKVTIKTDHPGGWKIQGITYEEPSSVSWLNVAEADQTGSVNEDKQISLIMDENGGTKSRVAFIDVVAGRLIFKLKVIQNTKAGLSLDIVDESNTSISELNFKTYKGQTSIPAQAFTVKWQPYLINNMENPCNFTLTPLGLSKIEFSGLNIPYTGSLTSSTGQYSYQNVQPVPFTEAELAEDGTGNPFKEKLDRIDYRVSNGISTVAKSFFIRMINYAAVPETEKYFLLNGGTYDFNIKSNSGWKVTIQAEDGSSGDPLNVIKSFSAQTGGYDIANGKNIIFTLKDKINIPSDIYYAPVTFKIENTDPSRYFETRYFTIDCLGADIVKSANSHILKPNGPGIAIPVCHYLKSFDKPNYQTPMPTDWIPTGDVLTAKFLWTTIPQPVGVNGNIKFFKVIGRGNGALLVVVPGSKAGSSAIGIEDRKGTAKWNWLIWVTDYNPYEKDITENGSVEVEGGRIYRFEKNNLGDYLSIYMDRNLGAASDVSAGFFYQYGRPTPSVNSTIQDLYDEKGNKITNLAPVAGPKSIADAIGYPMHIKGVILEHPALDWISVRSDNIYSTGPQGSGLIKSVYDPCPYGWGIPKYHDFVYNISTAEIHENYFVSNLAGKFPITGRTNSSGAMIDFKDYSYLQSVNPNGPQMHPGALKNVIGEFSSGDMSFRLDRADGLQVRCVRKTETMPEL